MQTAKLRDSGLAAIGVAIGAGALLLVPYQIPGGSLGDISEPASSAFFPIVVSSMLVVCCLILLVGTLLRPLGDDEAATEPLITWNYLQGAAVLTGYVFLVSWIGMLIATGLMIATLSYAFGYRNWPFLIGTAVLVPLSIWFVFRKLLYIVFPAGMLF